MAEALTQIARRPPLGEIAAELTAGIAPGVLDIRLLPPRARFTLRVAPALLPAGGEVAGFALDAAINRFRTSAQRIARCAWAPTNGCCGHQRMTLAALPPTWQPDLPAGIVRWST